MLHLLTKKILASSLQATISSHDNPCTNNWDSA